MMASTAEVLARSKAMLEQTKAQGSKPFAGSSYDVSAVDNAKNDTPDSRGGSGLRSLGGTDAGTSSATSAATGLADTITSQLTSAIKGLGTQDSSTKSILDTYAERRAKAQEMGNAQRSLTENKYAGLIEGAADTLGQSLNLEAEARRGFATNTALVKQITDSGAKRIRELGRDRDSLLLQQNYEEAGRIDSLIADEQSAITEARKSWLDSFISLTGAVNAQQAEKRAIAAEDRAVRSFETPDVKREQDYTYAEKTANATALRQLMTAAPDAGITANDDYDTAVQKYRNSNTYKLNQKTAEAQLEQINASISKTYDDIADAKAKRSLSAAFSGDVTGLGDDAASLTDAFNNALPFVDTKFQSDEAKRQFNGYLQAGRVDQAKQYLKSMVKSSVDQTTRDKLNAGEQAISALQSLQADLAAYKAKGGSTNVLTGTLESIANKVGQTSDPELAKLGNKIKLSIQNYRKAISGAAFSESEGREYASIFPSYFSSEELNEAKIQGALEAITGNQSSIYSGVFGAANYDAVFGGGTGGSTGGGSAAPTATAAPVVPAGNLFSSFFGGSY